MSLSVTLMDELDLAGKRVLIREDLNVPLKDGDVLELGAVKLEILHTPGHTKDGISLLGDNAVFTGDALFAGSIGRTDFLGGSYEELIRSIKTKLLSLPDSITMYPGHGPSTTIGDERQHNPFLQT